MNLFNLSIMSPEALTIIYYALAAIAQLVASFIALSQIKKLTEYRMGWILLASGLTLMMSRRLVPLYELFESGTYSLSDAELAFVISLLLMFGVIKLRKLFDYMQLQKQQLEHLAKYDYLTGALSRYAIIDYGHVEVERSLRLKRPLTILLIDIDKFKNINDCYGHVTGDDVLVQFVNVCKTSLRNIDLFGRFGGDEFIAILPETNAETATQIANRLQIEINTLALKSSQDEFKISASIGIGTFDPTTDALDNKLTKKIIFDQLIRHADLNMYKNKQCLGVVDKTSSTIDANYTQSQLNAGMP